MRLLEAAGFELVFANPGRTPTEEQLLELLPECVGWIAGVEPISERVLRAATKLRVISRNGTGTDNIPLGVAKELGIRIERAEGANARGVAELSIALMFAALRNIPELHHALRGGQWQRRGGIEISDRLVVLIGCGAVGRLVIQMALGLRARTAAYDPFPNYSFMPAGDGRLSDGPVWGASTSRHCSWSVLLRAHSPTVTVSCWPDTWALLIAQPPVFELTMRLPATVSVVSTLSARSMTILRFPVPSPVFQEPAEAVSWNVQSPDSAHGEK